MLNTNSKPTENQSSDAHQTIISNISAEFKKNGGKSKTAKNIESETPATKLPKGFSLEPDGVYYTKTDKDGIPETPIKICSPLTIKAYTRNVDGDDWGRLLEFHDADDRKHSWAMPASLLAGDCSEIRSFLLSRGLYINSSAAARSAFLRYIQETDPQVKITCVQKTGWHGSAYVLPDETINDAPGERIVFQAEHFDQTSFGVAGTLESWRENIAKYAANNPRLTFAISTAFAAPVLPIVDEMGGGFHFLGSTSVGKTTLLLIGGSVFGGGSENGFLESWRATANGLESVAAAHNHSLLCLDEIKECNPFAVGEAAYMLGNGQGKTRMNKTVTLRRRLQWKLLFLSSGEVSLSNLIEQAGGRVYGGQEVRCVELRADSGKFGVFNYLHDFKDGDALATHLRLAIQKNYGTPARAFIKEIAGQTNIVEQWQKFLAEFAKDALPLKVSGEVQRVCRRFALVGFAGELARNITKWTPGAARDAARVMFAEWLESRGGETTDSENIISQMRHFLETQSARFEKLKIASTDFPQIISNRAGFVRENADGSKEYLVPVETFRREILKNFDLQMAQKVLADHSFLRKSGDGKFTRPERINPLNSQKPTRVYVITDKIFEDETEVAENE